MYKKKNPRILNMNLKKSEATAKVLLCRSLKSDADPPIL